MYRVLAAAAAATLVTGCASLTGLTSSTGSTVTPGQNCGRPPGMIIIVGAHRNAPEPSLGPVMTCQLTAAIQAGVPVRIVISDGQPQVIDPQLAPVTGGTLAQQASPRAREDVQRVQRVIAAARPASAGADDLAALAIAADEAHALGVPGAELVLLDSGLDDRGALNFTVPGMVAATPAEVAGQLKSTRNLPDLSRFTVVLAGIGYTAPPQVPLPARWRANLTQIWTTVATAAGAKVQVIPQPGQSPSIVTNEPVQPVPVPTAGEVTPAAHATIVFTGTSPVQFDPNSASFIDQSAVVQALRPIARWLAASSSRHAWLEGTTADVGPITGQVALSVQRADHVRSVLVSLGASPGQITTSGVGSRFPQFVRDRDAAGALLAAPATLNRSVRITLS
jgi:OOP family OmpA-OmpF porin